MHDRSDIRAFDPTRPAVWARFATSTAAIPPGALLDDHAGLAVALARDETPARAVAVGAAAFVVETRAEADALGPRAVVVSDDAIDGADHPAIGTFNRARRRDLLGLPAELVVTIGLEGDDGLTPQSTVTALALASSAAVSGPAFVIGLALGTPMVTDAATAGRYGARDGNEAVIAKPSAARARALDLAADHDRAAAVGRHATQLFATSFDARAAAVRVIEHLDLPRPDPFRRLRARLDELGTPAMDQHALRALASCIELTPDRRNDIMGARA